MLYVSDYGSVEALNRHFTAHLLMIVDWFLLRSGLDDESLEGLTDFQKEGLSLLIPDGMDSREALVALHLLKQLLLETDAYQMPFFVESVALRLIDLYGEYCDMERDGDYLAPMEDVDGVTHAMEIFFRSDGETGEDARFYAAETVEAAMDYREFSIFLSGCPELMLRFTLDFDGCMRDELVSELVGRELVPGDAPIYKGIWRSKIHGDIPVFMTKERARWQEEHPCLTADVLFNGQEGGTP